MTVTIDASGGAGGGPAPKILKDGLRFFVKDRKRQVKV
jgi:hypothetical protein